MFCKSIFFTLTALTSFSYSSSLYYFGYGSNLLQERMHVNNKNAKRAVYGELKNYRLDFNGNSKRWNGSPATIVPTVNSSVYGAIWEMQDSDLPNLDRQEGVDKGIYTAINVSVKLLNNETVNCRVYHLVDQPTYTELESIPYSRQPSKTYLKTIVKGAEETGLPEFYIQFLKCIKHNGNEVEEWEKTLHLEDVQLSCKQ